MTQVGKFVNGKMIPVFTVVAVKRWESTQQNVHNDTQRPYVARLVILLRPQDLGCGVVRRIARCLQSVFNVSLFSEAKIRQFYDSLIVR